MFKFDGKDYKSKELRVHGHKVIDALKWLTGKKENGEPNNPRYQDVFIDVNRFNSLPEDDYIRIPMNANFENCDTELSDDECDKDNDVLPDMGPNFDQDDEKVYDCNTEMGSFIRTKIKSKMEKEIINDSVLKQETIKIGNDALSEFTTEYLVTLAFPTLFPNGKGDLTKFSTKRSIAKSDTESFSEKIKHLIKYAEFIDGKWIYRFAAHPRFGFWA